MLTDNKVMADNDVDAADLHLLLNPEVMEAHDFVGGQKAMIDATKCMGCGECEHACHFNAIHCDGPLNERGRVTCRVDVLACEGCGLCEYVCPAGAVSSRPNITGA
jgi:MinD superfamily P-loop ATPase